MSRQQIEAERDLFYDVIQKVTEQVGTQVDSFLWDYFTENSCFRMAAMVKSEIRSIYE